MGFAKNDFVAEVKIRDSEKVNFITLSMLENLDMKAIFPKRIEIYGKSNDRWLPINQLEIDLQDHPDDRKSYFKEFTLAVNLEGYNEVKIVAVNLLPTVCAYSQPCLAQSSQPGLHRSHHPEICRRIR